MKAATASAVLTTARAQLGRSPYEQPPGSNRTYFGAHYGLNGVAWCAISAWCVFDWTPGGAQLVLKTGLVEAQRAWMRNHDQYGQNPRPGALIFLNFGAAPPGVAHHVGLVEAVAADAAVTTLEGNTGGRAAAERGDGYYRRARHPSSVVGYGYPAYAPEPARRRRKTPEPPPGSRLPALTPGAAIGRVLRIGSTGADVATVQRALGIADDGDFGPYTQAAVRAAQTSAGIPADGIVGPITAHALALTWKP